MSVIIVTYHSAGTLSRCLDSLPRFFGGVEYEVVLVNNGGGLGPGVGERPEVELIEPGENLGFGTAANLGADQSRAHVLFFLNPDAEVRSGSAEDVLEFLAATPDAAALGARIEARDQAFEPASARYLPRLRPALMHILGLERVFPNSSLTAGYFVPVADMTDSPPLEVEAVSGAAFVIRREAFTAVGGFDSDYFLFGEDLDLFARLGERCGKILYFPRLVLSHIKGASMRRFGFLGARYHMYRSMGVYFRKRNGPGALAPALAPAFWLVFLLTLPTAYWRWLRGAGSLK